MQSFVYLVQFLLYDVFIDNSEAYFQVYLPPLSNYVIAERVFLKEL